MSVLDSLKNHEETVWFNPNLKKTGAYFKDEEGYGFVYVKAAQNRFMRFLPYIAAAFPETAERKGVIESPLREIPALKNLLNARGAELEGRLFLKDDARLPIAGSVKARGGIHEVLKHTEMLLQRAGKLNPTENYAKLLDPEYRDFLCGYSVQVGSTGNLGISIGRTAARLGYHAVVHMSRDAAEWKKALLRSEGVEVREYEGDYSEAVAAGRKASESDPKSYFVDDENSEDLFFGYATAALRLHIQLAKAGVKVDEEHPLFVYLPCGVGGAPAGISFGLKQLFGDFVHCFFAEPVEAPCFLLGMASGLHESISVQDIGLSGRTAADGLAVGRPSGFACDRMEPLLSGCYTLTDERLLQYQAEIKAEEDIFLEPSACAGFLGAEQLCRPDSCWADYVERQGLRDKLPQAAHIVWGTGGGLLESINTNRSSFCK